MTRRQEVNNIIKDKDDALSSDNFYPNICTTSRHKRRLLLKNDGHDFQITEPNTNQTNSSTIFLQILN